MHATVKLAPAFSLGARRKDQEATCLKSPGPGRYKSEKSKFTFPVGTKPCNATIATNSRARLKVSVAVDANYEVDATYQNVKCKSPSYTMRPRVSKQKGLDVPGPGTYPVQTKFDFVKRTNPQYSMRAHLRDPSGLSVPGPGTHEHGRFADQKFAKSPQYSLRRRTPAKRTTNMLAPGPKYAPSTSFVKSKSPTWRQGKDKRFKARNARTPGPIYDFNQYAQRSGVQRSASYSLRPRTTQLEGTNMKSPGAGTYKPMKFSVMQKSPSFSFNGGEQPRSPVRRKRFGSYRNNVPGPGTYIGSGNLFGRR